MIIQCFILHFYRTLVLQKNNEIDGKLEYFGEIYDPTNYLTLKPSFFRYYLMNPDNTNDVSCPRIFDGKDLHYSFKETVEEEEKYDD